METSGEQKHDNNAEIETEPRFQDGAAAAISLGARAADVTSVSRMRVQLSYLATSQYLAADFSVRRSSSSDRLRGDQKHVGCLPQNVR